MSSISHRDTSPPDPVALRDYQVAALEHVHRAISTGKRRIAFSLPTGTGKGVLIGAVARDVLPRGRVIVVAHLRELIGQLANHCEAWCGQVGVVMAEQDTEDRAVTVASIQTLRETRLNRVLSASPDPIAALIIDEYHHATSRSYQRLIETVTRHSPGVVLIGCSATPFRADNEQLSEVFPHTVFERSIPDMQRAGWLAPMDYQRVVVPMRLADLVLGRSGDGRDYQSGDLALDAMRPAVIHALVEGTAPLLGNRKVLAFAAGVDHARLIADAYNTAGIVSAYVHGGMSPRERADILNRWRAGDIQLVANDSVLVEGFDLPEISALVLARPTASLVRYMQQLGRGTRIADGKDDCLVLEATPGRPDERQVTLGDVDPTIDLPRGGPRHPTLVLLDPRQDARFRFFDLSAFGCYVAPINADASLWLIQDPGEGSGLYHVARCDNDGVRHITADPKPLYVANRIAARYLLNNSDTKLARKHQWWHQQNASDRQMAYIRYRAPSMYRSDLTRGEASNIISLVKFAEAAPAMIDSVWPVLTKRRAGVSNG